MVTAYKSPRKMAGFGLMSDGVPLPIGDGGDSEKQPSEPPRGSTPVSCDITRRIRKVRS